MPKQPFDIQEPFRVPEHYFEGIADRVMARLPERQYQPVAIVRRRPPLWRAAAAVAVVAVMAAGWYGYATAPAPAVAGNESQQEQQYSVDDIANYAMLDHQDVYELISE